VQKVLQKKGSFVADNGQGLAHQEKRGKIEELFCLGGKEGVCPARGETSPGEVIKTIPLGGEGGELGSGRIKGEKGRFFSPEST